MMKRAIMKFMAIVLILCTLVAGNITTASAEGQSEDIYGEYLQGIIKMIKDKYNGQVTDKQLVDGALKGLFGTMDQYTTYYTPSEAEKFFGDVGGQYDGIGISMGQEGDYIVVLTVFNDSPAQKAGIVAGDRITAVDGRSVIGMAPEDAVPYIKGTAGTIVTLSILRDNEKEAINIDVMRAKIKINPVKYEIRGDIGYIKIDSFNSNAYLYIQEALKYMDTNKIEKIILDLRDNPGGEVNQAAAIATYFVPEGTITKLDFNSPYYTDIEYQSELKALKYKLAVLVNEGTASASEILAGAIQDTGAGVLVGTNTFGKAKVQSLLPILTPEACSKYAEELGVDITGLFDIINRYGINPLESEIIGWTKMTTGMYFTPKGRMIDGTGLQPDVAAEEPAEVNGINIFSIQKLQKITKPTLNDKNADIFNAEKLLKLLGFDIDTPDMLLDEKTFKAIMQFQERCGLFAYGLLDFTTQQALNDVLTSLTPVIDSQYGRAVQLLNK